MTDGRKQVGEISEVAARIDEFQPQGRLELLGLELTSRPGRYGRYMALVDQLAGEARVEGLSLSARDVDLGLFNLGGPVA